MQIRLGPPGVHLFFRKTGTNVLINEAQVPSSLWSTAPRNVSVALTNICDLHCPYCYAPKTSAHLDTGVLIDWIDELGSNGCLGVGFGGGEPTLSPDLPWLCKYIDRNTPMAATITTHGHHLDDTLASDLMGHVHYIRVSMDGVTDTYEALRGRPFSRFMDNLKIIARLAPFGINFVVNSRTFPCLDRAIQLSAEAGATQFLLLPERPTALRLGIDHGTFKALRRWVQSYTGSLGLAVSEEHQDGLPVCSPLAQETRLRAYVHIDATAQLKRFSYDRSGVPIGRTGIMSAIASLEATLSAKEDR